VLTARTNTQQQEAFLDALQHVSTSAAFSTQDGAHLVETDENVFHTQEDGHGQNGIETEICKEEELVDKACQEEVQDLEDKEGNVEEDVQVEHDSASDASPAEKAAELEHDAGDAETGKEATVLATGTEEAHLSKKRKRDSDPSPACVEAQDKDDAQKPKGIFRLQLDSRSSWLLFSCSSRPAPLRW
jgi:hypothetical protein